MGERVQEPGWGGGVPHWLLLLPLEVRRRWPMGGVPRENWMLGGDMETTSGAGELGGCAAEGGAETRRDLEEGNCLVGERGEEAGEQREEVRRRRSAGEVGGWSPTTSSSGRGPRVEWEEEAEETPDMPDTDWLASCCVREVTRECWMAA